jgi:glycosyltransferase involved in cell wall biosynthesis
VVRRLPTAGDVEAPPPTSSTHAFISTTVNQARQSVPAARALPSLAFHRHGVVVAIPAKNEARRIGFCLLSLAMQTHRPDAVVLLANNCTDRTTAIAEKMSAHLPYRLLILSRMLPRLEANAGHARRLAMQSAAKLAGSGGVLMTTDADSVVASDWVERNLVALLSGADAVCGRVQLHPGEHARIPAHLHADDALECELIALADRMAHCIDPDPADPWPRHTEAAGASLAVTVSAFERIGGVPAMESGEDRAFVSALARIDARIRHDPTIIVTVSGRIDDRTPGGMAETIRRRMIRQDEFTDRCVEPAVDACRRFDFRRRVRLAWQGLATGQATTEGLAADLGIAEPLLRQMLRSCFFGMAWERIEERSPIIRRRRVRFADLPREIAYARELLEQHIVPDATCP